MTTLDGPVVATEGYPPQRFGGVLRSELGRIYRRGGLRIGLIVAGLAGLLVGGLVLRFTYAGSGWLESASGDDDVSAGILLLPIENAVRAVALLLAVAVVSNYGRLVQNGGLVTGLIQVPRRGRLFAAQVLATAIAAGLLALLIGAVFAVAGLIVLDGSRLSSFTLLALVGGAAATAMMAVLAQSIAMIVGRAIAALLLVVGWWFIAPVVLGIAGPFLPEWVADVTRELSQWFPLDMLIAATGASAAVLDGVGAVLREQGALLAFTAVFAAVAYVVLRRRSF